MCQSTTSTAITKIIMGNEPSSREQPDKTAGSGITITTTMTTPSKEASSVDRIPFGGGSNSKAPKGSGGRRIVKAAHPVKSPASTTMGDSGVLVDSSMTSPSSKEEKTARNHHSGEEEDDDDFEKVSSPLAAVAAHSHNEVFEESSEMNVAVQSTLRRKQESRRLSKRQEQHLQHRRKNGSTSETEAAVVPTTPTPPPATIFSANPMSRFLSAFSVDASHPKRAHAPSGDSKKLASVNNNSSGKDAKETEEDDNVNRGPVEKRPRTEQEGIDADDANDVTATNNDKEMGASSTVSSKFMTLTSVLAVATAALMVGLALRWSRSTRRGA